MIDEHAVTNEEYAEFVRATSYVTESEMFKWSFVLEYLASAEVIRRADSGLGRVKGCMLQ
jgi:formylglycine-generating enzyme required for sulfatase activity